MAESSKVFISYAHEDRRFRDRVHALADRLETLGLDVIFDVWDAGNHKGWTQWMLDGVQKSDFVLCVCTRLYCMRVNGDQQEGTGLGAQWEGHALNNLLQSEPVERGKVQVVQFDEADIQSIPLSIRSNNRFLLKAFDLKDDQFADLYAVLTRQPVEKPPRGSIVELPGRNSPIAGLTVLPAKGRPDAHGVGAPTSGLRMQMADGTPESIPGAKKHEAPGRVPGKGQYLQRLSRKRLGEAFDAFLDDRFEDALLLAAEARRCDGTLIAVFLLEGRVFFDTKRWAQAAVAFERYLAALDPPPLRELFRLHVSRCLAGDVASRTFIEDAASEHSGSLDILLDYFEFLDEAGEHDRVMALLRDRIRQDRLPSLVGRLAVYEWYDGNVEEATSLLEEVSQNAPRSVAIWMNLGVGRAEMRRFGLAIEALRRALALRPRHEFARYALAEVYALMGDAEAALEPLSELVQDRSYLLRRISTERTFDAIRSSGVFKKFISGIPPELLEPPAKLGPFR